MGVPGRKDWLPKKTEKNKSHESDNKKPDEEISLRGKEAIISNAAER